MYVPDYQIRGIKFVDNFCTFPEVATVGAIFGTGREREVVIESLSRTIASLFPGSREV